MPDKGATQIWDSMYLLCAAGGFAFLVGLLTGWLLKRFAGLEKGLPIQLGLSIVLGGLGAYLMMSAGIVPAIIAGVSIFIGYAVGFGTGTMLGLGGGGFEVAFSKRITFKNHRAVTRLVVILAVASIALGVMVMEISVSIVSGFQQEIQAKIVGFGSHIQIGNFLRDIESTLPQMPKDEEYLAEIRNLEEVKSVSPFVSLPSMMKSEATQEGVLMKGVDKNYDFEFFNTHLRRGRLPNLEAPKESKEILISEKTASIMNIDTGDAIIAYFLMEKPKPRKVTVVGVYESGLEEFDKITVVCDMRLLQRIVKFPESDVMGFEVNLHSLDDLDSALEKVHIALPPDYSGQSIVNMNAQMFDWLELQHQQVWIIIVMMILIAVINMVSVILILILERTRTIGLLRTMGLSQVRIRRVFLFAAIFFIVVGVLIGNIGGASLLWLQDTFGMIKVSQENYFIREVPVMWVWDRFLVINIAAIVISALCMFIPTRLVSGIDPVKAIRFD